MLDARSSFHRHNLALLFSYFSYFAGYSYAERL